MSGVEVIAEVGRYRSVACCNNSGSYGDVGGDASCLVAGELGPRPAIACARRKSASLQGRTTSRHGETMRRREFIALMGASVAWPFAAVAQQAGRTYRLGLITTDPFNDQIQGGAYTALLDGLRRLGFIEGKNLAVDNRVVGRHPELQPELCSRADQG
jgi:hypothetical protein